MESLKTKLQWIEERIENLDHQPIIEKIKEMEEKLPQVKTMCICKTCPTYVKEETEVGFCHPLIGKSKIITEEKGCNCPQCPVYTKMKLKNGYYCTRKSEMEQEYAKKMKKG